MRFDRCLGCMEKLETENAVCPHCGFDITHYEEAEYALRPGTLLQGKYMIGKVLGKGGFGITYIGFDMMLDIKVAIKEYYPEGFVGRDSRQSSKLTWYSTRSDVQYVKNSRDNLLKEARNMAKIDTFPTVARVREVFMANETAYLVMDYIEGETLKHRVMKNGVLTYGELRNYLCPVMADLAQIHEKGIIHRDISPDNIMVEPTGKARLLDLGAAKDLYQPAGAQTGQSEEDHGDLEETQMTGAGRNTQNIRRSEDVPKSTQMVLKKGFSPLEQYRMHGEIGPWTDVYAMAATMYYLLSGRVLSTPMDRLGSEEEETEVQDRINGLEIPEKAKEGMRKGLAILKKDRIGSMRELLEYLPERDLPKPEPVGPTPDPRKKWPFVLLGAAILASGGYAAMTGLQSTQKNAEQYYEEGNYQEALAAYREDGDTENVERVLQAMYDLAGNYKDGKNGVEKNEEEALRYFKLVAEDESAEDGIVENACFYLGYIMYHNDTEKDDAEAATWFEKAIEKGNVNAITYLGSMYGDGKGVTQDYEKAIELYKQAADTGEDYAMNNLGRIYEYGERGQEINLEEALKWYKLAAEKNHDDAQESVERVEQALQKETESDRSTEKTAEQYYEEGNYEEALTAYREAGDTENVERVLQAMFDQAENYKDGKNGVEKNEEEAIRYYELVAEDESSSEINVEQSCFYLGYLMTRNETDEDDSEAAAWYEKAIEKGMTEARFNLAAMYEEGQGVVQDYEKAISLYTQQADEPDAFAMMELGQIYENGECGQKKDLEEALKWYEQAANHGAELPNNEGYVGCQRVLQAMYELAEDYRDGSNGAEKNEEEAIRYFKLLAEDESAGEDLVKKSCTSLGKMLANNTTKEDDAEAVSWYEKATEKGDLEGTVCLGTMYQKGQGVAQDYEKAAELYRQAADGGNADGINKLAGMYRFGQGVTQDSEKAVELYNQAINKGSIDALNSLGAMYEWGSAGTTDYAKALELYQQAADGGCADALKNLGGMYEQGWGVSQDYEKAAELYQKAAELFQEDADNGDAVAMYSLGGMYEKGRGIAQDNQKALELYHQAAERENAEAMNWLGHIYEESGLGQQINLEEALKWYRLAAEKHYSGAQESVDRVLTGLIH